MLVLKEEKTYQFQLLCKLISGSWPPGYVSGPYLQYGQHLYSSIMESATAFLVPAGARRDFLCLSQVRRRRGQPHFGNNQDNTFNIRLFLANSLLLAIRTLNSSQLPLPLHHELDHSIKHSDSFNIVLPGLSV
jgi:hypothetical protein